MMLSFFFVGTVDTIAYLSKMPIQIKPTEWPKVFNHQAPDDAIDLVSKMLIYEPTKRIDPFDAMVHPFFDDLRFVVTS